MRSSSAPALRATPAAYTMAKAGLKVLQIERGEYPGSKNVQGAILYARCAGEDHPRLPRRRAAGAPHHRAAHVGAGRRRASSARTTAARTTTSRPTTATPSSARSSTSGSARKVREAGALLICETTVEELLMDGERVRRRALRPRGRRGLRRRGDPGRRREQHAGAQGRLPRRDQGRERRAGGEGNPLHARGGDPGSASTSAKKKAWSSS